MLADQFAAVDYGGLLPATSRMMTVLEFNGPARYAARCAATQGVPSYLYYFSRVRPGDPSGAQHSAEVPYVFASVGSAGGSGPQPADRRLSGEMAHYWATFAATGDPNAAGQPHWPRYDPAADVLLRLDAPVAAAGAPVRRGLRDRRAGGPAPLTRRAPGATLAPREPPDGGEDLRRRGGPGPARGRHEGERIMSQSLRERLIGAWELVDVVEEPVDGSAPRRPHGESPVGLILYSPDGYMSVQIMHRDRSVGDSADWSDLTPEEQQEEARTYFAYAGPYHVDEAAGILTHSMRVSLFPGWIGQTQPRVVELDGDSLRLSSAAPMRSGGRLVLTHLRWRRAGTSGAGA